jgi:hypothetical protein
MYSLRNPRGMCRFAAAMMAFEKRLYALEHAGMNCVTWSISAANVSQLALVKFQRGFGTDSVNGEYEDHIVTGPVDVEILENRPK